MIGNWDLTSKVCDWHLVVIMFALSMTLEIASASLIINENNIQIICESSNLKGEIVCKGEIESKCNQEYFLCDETMAVLLAPDNMVCYNGTLIVASIDCLEIYDLDFEEEDDSFDVEPSEFLADLETEEEDIDVIVNGTNLTDANYTNMNETETIVKRQAVPVRKSNFLRNKRRALKHESQQDNF
eukprot:Awhi_evm1s13366